MHTYHAQLLSREGKEWELELPYDPAIPLLGIYPKELKAVLGTWTDTCNSDVHSSVIHNNQKVEATQVSIHGWMDKQNVIYAYNGI